MPGVPIEETERNPEPAGCPIAADCGGCALVGEGYAEQLAWKTERVRSALAQYDVLAGVEVEPCLAAPEPWRYRNRAKLAVAESEGTVRIGLYRRGTNRIVDLAPCVVQRPVLQRGIERVRVWLAAKRLAAPTGPVFYVDLRETSNSGFHATFVVARGDARAERLQVEDLVADCPELAGVAVNLGDPDSSYPMGETTRVAHGGDTFDAPIPGDRGDLVSFAVPVSGFFQVATSLLPQIHRRMRAHLGEDGALYDLYCGVGVHGLMIERASSAGPPGIVGIEESKSACAAAGINAARLSLKARYVAGRVEDRLAEMLASSPATRFVLNPGRAGCKPAVRGALRGTDGARIAYLSCNPDTLARDLADMTSSSRLRARAVAPLDLMPQTDHVEALALLD